MKKLKTEEIIILIGIVFIFLIGSGYFKTLSVISYDPSVIVPKIISDWTPTNICPEMPSLGTNQIDGCYISSFTNTTGAITVSPNTTYVNSSPVYLASFTLHYRGNKACEPEAPYSETCSNTPADCGPCPNITTETVTISNTVTTTVIAKPPSFFESWWTNWNNFILQIKSWLHLQMVVR